MATAALDPRLTKDMVVTPGSDRHGEAKMSHVGLLNQTAQGTDNHMRARRNLARGPHTLNCSGYIQSQEGTEELNLDRGRRTRLESVERVCVYPQQHVGRGLRPPGQEPQCCTRAAALK